MKLRICEGAVALAIVTLATATMADDKSAPSSTQNAPDQGPSVFQIARDNRCQVALCYGGERGQWWAFEPLLELPVGKTFALPIGSPNALGTWIDSHDFSASFAGGVRVWFYYDWFSLSVYFSAPLTATNGTIHIVGSEFEYPTSSIRRPYPGVALGLFQDTFWLGLDYQELVNGDSNDHVDPYYPHNVAVSRAWSLTVGLATVTSVRAGIGTLAAKKAEEAARKAEEAARKAQETANKPTQNDAERPKKDAPPSPPQEPSAPPASPPPPQGDSTERDLGPVQSSDVQKGV